MQAWMHAESPDLQALAHVRSASQSEPLSQAIICEQQAPSMQVSQSARLSQVTEPHMPPLLELVLELVLVELVLVVLLLVLVLVLVELVLDVVAPPPPAGTLSLLLLQAANASPVIATTAKKDVFMFKPPPARFLILDAHTGRTGRELQARAPCLSIPRVGAIPERKGVPPPRSRGTTRHPTEESRLLGSGPSQGHPTARTGRTRLPRPAPLAQERDSAIARGPFPPRVRVFLRAACGP
jgi:hypothetical protein